MITFQVKPDSNNIGAVKRSPQEHFNLLADKKLFTLERYLSIVKLDN
jgi:hypothetical protein